MGEASTVVQALGKGREEEHTGTKRERALEKQKREGWGFVKATSVVVAKLKNARQSTLHSKLEQARDQNKLYKQLEIQTNTSI